MKKIFLYFFAVTAWLFSSCKNDFDVVDNYREIMVVYGLLNKSDTAQYIKINKAFLGRTNAYNMAAVYDSFNYVHGEISARLERWKNGSFIASIPLYRDSMIPKNAGVFAYPGQVFYKTTVPVVQDGSDYRIYVTNNRSGKTVNSSAQIVQDITVNIPIANQTINLVGGSYFKAKWRTAQYGRLHNLVIRMKYTERFIYDTLQVADKYVDLSFANVKSGSLGGNEQMEQTVLPETFYRNISNNPGMDSNPLKERFFKSLEFRFSAAGEEFSTYIDVANTTGITFGDHPFYSNINGGVGLFSSRYIKTVGGVGLSQASLDSLKNGQYTRNLRFR